MVEKRELYASVKALDSKEGAALLLQQVDVEEKIDGRRVLVWLENGELQAPQLDHPAIHMLRANAYQLNPDYVYVLEVLGENGEGVRTQYGRAPRGGAFLLDVRTPEGWLSHEEKFMAAEQLGFEAPPLLYQGRITDAEMLGQFLSSESVLGGPMEGIIIKPLQAEKGKTVYATLQTGAFTGKLAFERLPRHQGNIREMESFLQRDRDEILNGTMPMDGEPIDTEFNR